VTFLIIVWGILWVSAVIPAWASLYNKYRIEYPSIVLVTEGVAMRPTSGRFTRRSPAHTPRPDLTHGRVTRATKRVIGRNVCPVLGWFAARVRNSHCVSSF